MTLLIESGVNLNEIITPANFSEALRNYHNHFILNSHPMAALPVIQQQADLLEANRGERKIKYIKGAALSAELKKLITSLEPLESDYRDNRLPYEVLLQTVIQGRSAKEAATRLFMSRSQLYRIREKAIANLCQLWLEQEEVLLKPLDPLPERDKAPSPENNGSLRVVTILNANISGLNKAISELEPEEAHALLHHLLNSLASSVLEFGGYITQWYERGLCVIFGAPLSHEDDAVQAVRCALAMQTALAESRHDWRGTQLLKWPELRIALSTGRVFAGVLGPQGYNVTGVALQLAKGLTEQVPGGWILLEEQTYKLVRGLFQIESLDALTLDEEIVQSPVAVYRVLGQRPQGELIGVRGVQGVETDMVGRSLEWSILTRLYEECLEQNSVRQITIVGNGGIGKSRLEYEFRQYIELQPHFTNYWRGYSNPYTRQPYQPFATMLNYAAGIITEDTTETRRIKLLNLCQRYFSGAGQLTGFSRAEEAAHLLSLILEIGWDDSPVMAILEQAPATAQFHTFKVFAELCIGVSAVDPLVIVLQDLHWAEETTLLLWYYLSSELPDSNILLVGTARPELYERKPEWDSGSDRHFRLNLKSLTPVRSRELIRHILRYLPQVPESIVEQIAEAAEGNPFCIEEIIKMMLEEHYIAVNESDGSWYIARPMPTILPTPGTLKALIQTRLDRLPPPEKEALELASIVGHNFSGTLLIALLPAEYQPEAQELEERLNRLVKREFIVKNPNPTNVATFRFKHSLLREVLNEGLPRKRRVSLHIALAEYLEMERHAAQNIGGFASEGPGRI
jgi:class 3 adenylate cyclase